MKNITTVLEVLSPGAHITNVDGVLRLPLPPLEFSAIVIALVSKHGLRLALMYGTDDSKTNQMYGVHVVLTSDIPEDSWLVVSTAVVMDNPTYPSLTTQLMSAYWYERYLHDMFGIIPEGHPDLRRLVHHENIPEGTYPLRKDFAWNAKLPVANVPFPMPHVAGEGIFEIPVGPIHAGIIEPGHFRFSVAGERIITLEGKLFFTHKGVEKLIEGKTPLEALPFIERISGDMSAAHSLAYVSAVENALDVVPSNSSHAIRAFLVEMERITMHIHDIANIGGMGTGFALISSRGFAIKERMMRLSAALCGNRFWRGMIIPGGITRVFTQDEIIHALEITTSAVADMMRVADIALSSEAFRERLDTTGTLQKETALAYGALGIAARGSGILRDARANNPYGAYKEVIMNIPIRVEGDIMARFALRIDELKESLRLIALFAEQTRDTRKSSSLGVDKIRSDGFGIGIAESWRGEIVVAVHITHGVIERCVVRDPSFINWQLFGELAPGNIIPDFPLCNKSLNLSYSGTDM